MRRKINTWVVAADGARARILQSLGRGKGLALLGEMAAPHGRSLTRDLGADRPGRTQMASGNRHGVEPRSDLHELAEQGFVREVAGRLEEAARANAFDRLVIAAPPRTMGLLRKAFPAEVQKRIVGELTKDLTPLEDHALAEHVRDLARC